MSIRSSAIVAGGGGVIPRIPSWNLGFFYLAGMYAGAESTINTEGIVGGEIRLPLVTVRATAICQNSAARYTITRPENSGSGMKNNVLRSTARRLLYATIGRRNFEYRYHRRSSALLRAPSGHATGQTAADDALIDDIISRYRRAQPIGDISMWAGFFNSLHRDIHDALMNGPRSRVAEMLRNPASCDLFYGFDNLSRSLLLEPRLEDKHDAAQALDVLLCFAEALGARRLENPEIYAYHRASPVCPDTVLAEIETHLGIELPVPNPFPREFGLQTRRGILSYRAAQAMYQAWRLTTLKAKSVVEIGAGLGRTAFYANVMGISDYTIVDIPISTVAQSYFLGRTGVSARFVSPEEFRLDSRCYDVSLNVDSFTEMDQATAQGYIDILSKRSKLMLSINHESNKFTVRELIKPYQSTRCPSWNRRGYVEELVQF